VRPHRLLVDSAATSRGGFRQWRVRGFTPFGQQSSSLQPADRVVGQAASIPRFTDPAPSTMAAPYGWHYPGINGLLVSDVKLNRVLYFSQWPTAPHCTPGGDATVVVRTDGLNVVGKPTVIDDTVMTAPRHIAADFQRPALRGGHR